LTVGDGLLGQIVVDDHSMLAVVTEVFTKLHISIDCSFAI